ncbi:uncharacterized protein LY79DRAFT_524986 [Colletotrichum navitas]|uniref:Uncharacterized protein n=1 Tax=Colletotrichum navitas TaxID=681940 RepID=A0AAD8PPG3_9PEZI|nr:uncharacterized protein LY79DRAFT_524986 [Colletotrichum navitas]KAK1573892.1 hypothetical protein LY79DRAFT_524986 [Colletotrichum navitas]
MSQNLKYRPIDVRPGLASSLVNVRLWLEDCLQDHKGCMSRKLTLAKLPKRLIEILNERDLSLVEGVDKD